MDRTTALSFAVLTYSSATAAYRSRGDAPALLFVAVAYSDLVLLLLCLRALDRGVGSRKRLKAAVWCLSTLLTALFSYKVAAVLPCPAAAVVWCLAAAVAIGGFWAFFIYRDPPDGGDDA